MTDQRKDGGPAFPACNEANVNDTMGMTLRDWFAANADVVDIEFPDFASAADWMGIDPPEATNYASLLEFTFKLNAFIRYKKADAMLAAREKGGDA